MVPDPTTKLENVEAGRLGVWCKKLTSPPSVVASFNTRKCTRVNSCLSVLQLRPRSNRAMLALGLVCTSYFSLHWLVYLFFSGLTADYPKPSHLVSSFVLFGCYPLTSRHQPERSSLRDGSLSDVAFFEDEIYTRGNWPIVSLVLIVLSFFLLLLSFFSSAMPQSIFDCFNLLQSLLALRVVRFFWKYWAACYKLGGTKFMLRTNKHDMVLIATCVAVCVL